MKNPFSKDREARAHQLLVLLRRGPDLKENNDIGTYAKWVEDEIMPELFELIPEFKSDKKFRLEACSLWYSVQRQDKYVECRKKGMTTKQATNESRRMQIDPYKDMTVRRRLGLGVLP